MPGRNKFDTFYIAPNNQRFRSLKQVFEALDAGHSFRDNLKPIVVARNVEATAVNVANLFGGPQEVCCLRLQDIAAC